jgi:hypothetical protein
MNNNELIIYICKNSNVITTCFSKNLTSIFINNNIYQLYDEKSFLSMWYYFYLYIFFFCSYIFLIEIYLRYVYG